MPETLQLPDIFTQHPEVMSGAVVFKGSRVPVQTFFDHLDRGGTIEQFLEWYDGMTREPLEAALEIRTGNRMEERLPPKARTSIGGLFFPIEQLP